MKALPKEISVSLLIFCASLSAACAPALCDDDRRSPDPALTVKDLIFRTDDLEFKVEAIGGSAGDLQLKESPTELRIELAGDVLFDFDKWDIRPEAEPILQKVGEEIAKYPKASGSIEGHTDAKGAPDYNMRLSQKRAESVRNWLVKNAHLDKARFGTRGWGKTRPVAPDSKPDGSDDPDGRQKNRRVEIILKKGAAKRP